MCSESPAAHFPSPPTPRLREDVSAGHPKITGFDSGTGMVRATAVVEGKLVQFQFPQGGGPIRSIYPVDF